MGNCLHYILDRVLYARKGDGGEGGEGGQQRTIGGDLIDYETASVSDFNFLIILLFLPMAEFSQRYLVIAQRVDGHSTKLEKYMKTIIMALMYIL